MVWPRGTVVKYWMDLATGCPPELDPVAADAASAEGLTGWAEACGIRYVRVADRSQANLVTYWDPSVGVANPEWLALTQMPLGATPATQLLNRLNPRPFDDLGRPLPWTIKRLYLTQLHEGGHGIGQIHAPKGEPSIMSERINETLLGLTAFDVSNAQADYGPPAAPPAVEPDPAPPRAYAPTTFLLPDGATVTLQYTPPPRQP